MTGMRATRLHQNVARQGRLEVRPRLVTAQSPARGVMSLGLGGRRDGIVYVPTGERADQPAPLVVMLHGAGGNALQALGILQSLAEAEGVIVVAPDSRAATWDAIRGSYGPDVEFIDQALSWVFERYAVDPRRVAIGGFSDGASYGLSLGISNGDLFTHVLAFSPGFAAPEEQHGEPRLFVSHGTRDTVLPIDPCSRRLVPRLQGVGYTVCYREFDGTHTVPAEIACEAVQWFLAASR
jgi:phospholipase/carboxylesterase